MRNRTLAVVLAVLLCAVLSSVALAAAKSVKSPKGVAASKQSSAKFDQKAVMDKLWKAPDSAVVGTVGGVAVTKGELMKNMWYWSAPSALTEVLNQKMIENEAKKAKVTVSPAELQAKVKESLARSGMTDVNQLLAQYRITYARFLSGTKLSALAEKVVQSQMKIGDAEYAEYIQARHILIRFPQDEKDKTKQEEIAKKKIDEIAQKIKDGGDFAKLADENSEDPGNDQGGVKKGGDLGWFSKGKMVQEFETVAFEMTAGQISEPVKTFYGYHIIKVEKIGKDASAAEKAELKKTILAQKIPQEMSTWFQNLQAKTVVDNKLQDPATATPKAAAFRPSPPRPAPRPAPQPKVQPQPAPAEKPSGTPATEKPEGATPPPPPPPPPPAP